MVKILKVEYNFIGLIFETKNYSFESSHSGQPCRFHMCQCSTAWVRRRSIINPSLMGFTDRFTLNLHLSDLETDFQWICDGFPKDFVTGLQNFTLYDEISDCMCHLGTLNLSAQINSIIPYKAELSWLHITSLRNHNSNKQNQNNKSY